MTHFCRHCGSTLDHTVLDLGHQPPSNAYLAAHQLLEPEITYPLQLYVCTKCWLVQLPAHAPSEELFTSDYAYFSSTSSSWCAHAERFVCDVVEQMKLGAESYVVELASNDGYLLQYMVERNIPCLGIEPTHQTALASRQKGIDTLEEFFGEKLSKQLPKADLVVANNVLAHVPDINDFVSGIHNLLKPDGLASVEFPHLLNLLKFNQFDTIYHEHYSYFSLITFSRIAESVGLSVVKVEELSTHGGSLRVWLKHSATNLIIDSSFNRICNDEIDFGITNLDTYIGFQKRAESAKHELLNFLLHAKKTGKSVAAYGAAAKGNTLLNFAGVRSDLLPIIADKATSKQNKFMPGSHIPIVAPDLVLESKPDYLILLPWNIIDEIRLQIPDHTFVTAIPSLTIHSNEG